MYKERQKLPRNHTGNYRKDKYRFKHSIGQTGTKIQKQLKTGKKRKTEKLRQAVEDRQVQYYRKSKRQ